MNVIAHMVDCASPLTAANCADLKAAGISYVGRYLGYKSRGWSKGLTPEEVSAIHAHGMGIMPIWEGDPVAVADFTPLQGSQDAEGAIEDADWLGIPLWVPITATVDYDAQPVDMNAIRAYFATYAKMLAGRKNGIYGGIEVMDNVKADTYTQTCGWSNGQISPRADVYQRVVNQALCGVQVDMDDVYRDPGFWMPASAKPAPTPSNTLYDTGYNSGISDAIAAIGKLKK